MWSAPNLYPTAARVKSALSAFEDRICSLCLQWQQERSEGRLHDPRPSRDLSPETKPMPVSATNSRLIYDALKQCNIRLLSALPETWLVHLVRMADDDPEMILVRLAKEEEGG